MVELLYWYLKLECQGPYWYTALMLFNLKNPDWRFMDGHIRPTKWRFTLIAFKLETYY